MKSAKSLQIHSHNIFSRFLSNEYRVYQQSIYWVAVFSESKTGDGRLRSMNILVGTMGQSI